MSAVRLRHLPTGDIPSMTTVSWIFRVGNPLLLLNDGYVFLPEDCSVMAGMEVSRCHGLTVMWITGCG